MTTQEFVPTVLAFVEAINARNLDAIHALMSDDPILVDARGGMFRGRGELRKHWSDYFEWFPDYQVTVEQITQSENVIGLFGRAAGTYRVGESLLPENHWEVPAAWRAVVRQDKIDRWYVYADNSAVLQIIAANQPANKDSVG